MKDAASGRAPSAAEHEPAVAEDTDHAATQYQATFPASGQLYERERKVVPGGTTRGSIFYRPFPLYAVEAEGCRLRFEDGHEVVDFLNNFTTLVLGHAHPGVTSAVLSQIGQGNVFGAPTRIEVELAELLVRRYASIDRVLFTSTGSEAIMAALRLARATTGRSHIAKFEGGYHGGYDHAKVSATPSPGEWGDANEPNSVPDTAGIPRAAVSEVHVVGFNSVSSVDRVLNRVAGQLAALVVEPVMGAGGLIPPEPGFLRYLRDCCTREGILLVFDEVITQRLAVGGAQDLYGVRPDLTIFSKVMSAGFPIGVLGGTASLMDGFNPTIGSGPLVYHSGTFNANPVSVAAALATLRAFGDEEIQHIDALGQRLAAGLEGAIGATGAEASVTAVGSLVNVHFTSSAPREYRGVRMADRAALQELHLRLLREGYFIATRGLASISLPMNEGDIDGLISAVQRILGA